MTRRTQRRLIGTFVCVGCLGLFGLAAIVVPAPAGHGTHTQLGLTPCPWATGLDWPCPTCGMTTAFAYGVRGRLLASFHSQPFGFLMVVLTAAAFWASAHVAVTGSQVGRFAAALLHAKVMWLVAVLLGLAWAYKMLTWQGAG